MAHTDRLTPAPVFPVRLPRLDRWQAAPWLPAALLVFVAGAFLLPTGAAYAWPFYLLMLPAAALSVRRGLDRVRPPDPAPALALALLLWSGLTLAWGQDDGHRTWRFAIEAVWTLIFVGVLLNVLRSAEVRRQVGTVMIWAGAANAVLSVALGLAFPQHSERLRGWGATTHPILGATVMTTAYLCALSRGLSEKQWRAANLAACLAMAVFILMTESRGPMIAAFAGTLFLCLAGPWRLPAMGTVAAIAFGWLMLPASVHQHQEKMMLYRGSSHRFDIWHRTLDLIAQRPLFGHGLAANLDMPGGITFPHDLYLSVLFYSGAVGLALFAALGVAITVRLWHTRAWQSADWLWMAALWLNTLISGLTDLGQVTKGPGPMWFILWLPVGLVLTGPARSPDT